MRTVPILIFHILFMGLGLSKASPKIILKLDDLMVKEGICACSPTLDCLVQKQLKAGLGAISNRFDNSALKTLNPYLQATNSKGEKLFEIWNHGLDHVRPEFMGTGYVYQKTHFDEADQQIKNSLGIQMHSFGAPFNGSDSVTNRVISENPSYKVFMFSNVKPTNQNGMMYLDHRVNMENGTGNPEFSYFIENYIKLQGKYTDYMVLQGHPNQWTPEKLEQFKKIIDFLVSEGCEFILPYEYYKNVNK